MSTPVLLRTEVFNNGPVVVGIDYIQICRHILEESINTAHQLQIWEDMQLNWLDSVKIVPEILIMLFKTHGDQAGVKVDSSDSKLIQMKVTLKLKDILQLDIEN